MPRKSFWARLPFGVRMTTAGLGVLALVAGTAGGVVALTGDERADAVRVVGQEAVAAAPLDAAAPTRTPPQPPVTSSAPVPGHVEEEEEVPAITEDRSAPGEADRTATRAPRRPSTEAEADHTPVRVAAGGAVAAPVPVVRTARVSETQTIPFRTKLVRDPSLPRGSKRVTTRGVPGERVLHYEVTYTGTKETARRLLDSTVTREPQHRVIAFGRRSSGGDHDGDGRCNDRNECVPLARSAVCSDETKPEEEELLDQHLGLLSSDDLDALDLTLPCEDEE